MRPSALRDKRSRATPRRLAETGYREVESAGLFGHDPAQARSLLAELNLTA
jgi:hypothetical protein